MFDFDAVYLAAGGETFAAGKRYFYDNKVVGVNGNDLDGQFTVSGTVVGKAKHDVEIVFGEGGGLIQYGCDCVFFNESSSPCKHVIALALAYEDRYPQKLNVNKTFERERTDPIALTLSNEYSRKKRSKSFAGDSEKAVLIPILKYEDGGRLRVRFSIEFSGRVYVVKDLTDFAAAVNEGAFRRYGAGFEFEHTLSNFSSLTAKFVSFLVAAIGERTDAIKLYNGVNKAVGREGLLLTRGDADEFLALCEGTTVAFDDGEVHDSMRLVERGENTLNVQLSAEKVKGGFVLTGGYNAASAKSGAIGSKQFNIVNGKRFDYIVTDSRVHKVTREFSSDVLPLIRAFWSFKKLYVADSDMPYFYNNVLTSVLKFVSLDLDEGVDLSVFEAAPLMARLIVGKSNGRFLQAELKCAYEDEPVDILSDNMNIGFVRDYESEDALKDCLKKYFPLYPNLVLETDDEVYKFLSEGVSRLLAYTEVYLEESVRRMRGRKPFRVKVGVRIESNLLKVDFDSDELSKEDLATILSGYSERKKYVRLTDGTFSELSDSGAASIAQMFDLPKNFDGTLIMPKFYAPHLNSILADGFFTLERDKSFKALIQELNNVRDADIEVPPSLKDVMRSYQKTGFRWLTTLAKFDFGGILADDMGLGKSLQVIALFSKNDRPSIIVCPTTLTLNWVNEIKKFAPHLSVLTVSGNSEERREKTAAIKGADVVITSYELLRRDIDLYKDINFEFAIADEAQYIKNPDTKNAQTVKMLSSSHKFALTGTPVENSLSELWSIFDFVMPGYLGSYTRFKEQFETEIALGDSDAADKLKSLVSPFILRRLKSQVLTELPGKMEIEVESALENDQRQLYLANLAAIKKSVEDVGSGINKITVLSMLTKLRQICCEPRLAYKDYAGNSAKLDTCLELVREAVGGGHKVLLFSQFTSMLEIIRAKLTEEGITHYVLKGDTPKNERVKLVKRFNEDDTNVFLISLKAGGTGLNLTGADVVIHYDPWWNESVMNQATDRAYRIGQDKPVQVYKLIMKETLEERIVELQKQKSSLADLILGEGGIGTGTALSYDDILKLLG